MKKKAKKNSAPLERVESWDSPTVILSIFRRGGGRAGFLVEKRIFREPELRLLLAIKKTLPEARRLFDEQVKTERGVQEGS